MAIITDKNHIVICLSLIPGIDGIDGAHHCYFPIGVNDLPVIGEYYNPNDKLDENNK